MTAVRANVLVVDDMPAQRMAMEATLVDLEENVVAVGSGREALRYLLTQDVAVVLLDVSMPDLDGFETAALIRQRQRSRHTPIIFVTSDTDELLAAQAYSLGAVDYIVSPYHPDVLRTKVRVFVQLSKMQAHLAEQAEERVTLAREQAARLAAEESSHRLKVFAEAAQVLAPSLHTDSVFSDFLGIVLPFLGDLGGLVVRHGREQRAEARWAHVDPDGRLRPGLPGNRLAPALGASVQRVLRGGKLEVLGDGGGPSAIVLPLLLKAAPAGALVFARRASGRCYADADIHLAVDLASHAALALESRRLYLEIEARDRRKDEFLAMLGHELRNPLGAITTAVRLLELVGSPEERAIHARKVIGRQATHLTRLIDDLLDVARVTTGHIVLRRQPVDAKATVERSLSALRAAGRLERHDVVVDADPVWLEADATRIEQIVTNLVTNALKYTDPGGTVWVTAKAEGDRLAIRVRDTGIGISAEMLPHIFDLFVQGRQSLHRAQGGLGIGLTLVRRLVELQGGSAHAESQGPRRGSTFTVRLPLACAPCPGTMAPGEAEPTARAIAAKAALRLLVVEDDADAREMLRSLLELSGHEVYEAADGPSGVERAIQLLPQLALIDLGLPGFDGFEVAARIREAAGRDIILVAVTGYGQPQDLQRTREAGFDAHLVKPVSSERLDQVLARAAAHARRAG